ncbi:dynamin family protein [Ilumatobacter sp.]|uniref:dynamin family protein n=1 Tax=Ilumatobacter sp. TaxID=1967498 RepID=UPI003AF7D9B8
MSDTLLDDLRSLLDRTRASCDDPMVGARLDRLAERLDEPLIVAIAGKVKAGKSTLLNALIGEELAPTDAGECTRIVTWYRNGPTYRVTIESDDGTERQVPFHRDEGALEVDLGGQPVERIRRMTVDWPSARLSDLTLIDTPGLESVSTRTSDRTHTFLGTDGESHAEADAVIYLMKHLHRADIGFLEAFRDDADATASPISAISVLSRADEVGVCRLDAMVAANRIATTWRNDPRLRRLCQTVVPVAGLVAQAGASLTEQEFQALRTIARLPRPQVDALLLTVDRFVNTELDELTPVERELLLERFGVFGIRLSVSLIRLGAADHARMLADELWRRSGVEELRFLLGTVFAERRDILKARVALAGLDTALGELEGPEIAELEREIERIGANAHQFREIHVLHALRSGRLPFTATETDEVERLLGSVGSPSRARLAGLHDGDSRQAALDALERWRIRSENPMSPLDVVDAARVVIRTYEGLLAASDER